LLLVAVAAAVRLLDLLVAAVVVRVVTEHRHPFRLLLEPLTR
jgi:hypothetical protein